MELTVTKSRAKRPAGYRGPSPRLHKVVVKVSGYEGEEMFPLKPPSPPTEKEWAWGKSALSRSSFSVLLSQLVDGALGIRGILSDYAKLSIANTMAFYEYLHMMNELPPEEESGFGFFETKRFYLGDLHYMTRKTVDWFKCGKLNPTSYNGLRVCGKECIKALLDRIAFHRLHIAAMILAIEDMELERAELDEAMESVSWRLVGFEIKEMEDLFAVPNMKGIVSEYESMDVMNVDPQVDSFPLDEQFPGWEDVEPFGVDLSA
ncbi:MAG: hypothetical protein ACYTEQ_05380 [Planctomycetota bacterium]|jgi:hypothetical protein